MQSIRNGSCPVSSASVRACVRFAIFSCSRRLRQGTTRDPVRGDDVTPGTPSPYAEVRLPFNEVPKGQITHEALTWDNSQNGWFTPNFIDADGNATGESLLVTAQIKSGSPQTRLLRETWPTLQGISNILSPQRIF